MSKTVDTRDAKAQLSRPIARVERRERIVIARAGKPDPELRPTRNVKKPSRPLNDRLLRVEEYSYSGPIRSTANQDIDRIVYRI